MTTCTRTLEFDAAHRVMRHESKCATLHGHRYKVEITCRAGELDEVGRVIDFGVIKEKVGGWIDRHWDHTTIVNAADHALRSWVWHDYKKNGKRRPWILCGEPTAENMARFLLGQSRKLIAGDGIDVVKVRIYETPNCYAEAEGLDTMIGGSK